MLFLYGLASLVLIFVIFMLLQSLKMRKGRARAEQELSNLKVEKFRNPGSVKNLSVTPLVDFYSSSDELSTEEGVSYLIQADDTTILFDLGYNKKGEHPSPLLRNMTKLGVKPADIDMVFISHPHGDHVGGFPAAKRREFTLSAGPVALKKIPVYAPGDLSPAQNNPEPVVEIVKEPRIIGKGMASIGVYPRSLFLIGYTSEHSLAINVKGKGIVLIIGCGHQGIDSIIERTKQLFDEPIYGIIGGLHFPVNGGRVMAGPFNMQNIVGVDRRPLFGIRERDVESAIEHIKSLNPGIVALSAHDSSDWTLERFKDAFGDRCRELRVGRDIKI